MKFLKFIFIIVLPLLIISCDKDDDFKIMILTVAPQKVNYNPPFGEAELMGYAVTDSDNNQFVIDYIHDFEDKYEEGYEYVIKVKAEEKNKGKKPIVDVFGYSYYLIEIISKEHIRESRQDRGSGSIDF